MSLNSVTITDLGLEVGHELDSVTGRLGWSALRTQGLVVLAQPAKRFGRRLRLAHGTDAGHSRRLDPFTPAGAKAHVATLDEERRDLWSDYHQHGVLFCWEDGRPPHPDTITRRIRS